MASRSQKQNLGHPKPVALPAFREPGHPPNPRRLKLMEFTVPAATESHEEERRGTYTLSSRPKRRN